MFFSLLIAIATVCIWHWTSPLAYAAEYVTDDTYASSIGKQSDFFVDGRHIPGVPFTISDSYAGLLPITDMPNETKKLFFWWYPVDGTGSKDDLVIWLNGGPGCSSLGGMLQGNGPWQLPYNSTEPVKNPFSWTMLANILYVEQPIGTGLSEGTPDITNEEELAVEFYGFLFQFFSVFTQLKGKRLWLTGESYAGKYIPYIASHILELEQYGTNAAAGIKYMGFAFNDPSFEKNFIMQDVPAVDFALKNRILLGLNDSYIDQIKQNAIDNGVLNFATTHLQYPQKVPITLPDNLSSNYSAWNSIAAAAFLSNPCFNVYNINFTCPSPTDPLGRPPGSYGPSSTTNFINNQTGFKEYVHADQSSVWVRCTSKKVFAGDTKPFGDTSPAPADTNILQRVLEASPAQRSMIVHGELDFVLLADGSALAIQNTTWNGAQGFQHGPKALIIDHRHEGSIQSERGLTFARLTMSGHKIAQDRPRLAYVLLQFLLGQVTLQELTT